MDVSYIYSVNIDIIVQGLSNYLTPLTTPSILYNQKEIRKNIPLTCVERAIKDRDKDMYVKMKKRIPSIRKLLNNNFEHSMHRGLTNASGCTG